MREVEGGKYVVAPSLPPPHGPPRKVGRMYTDLTIRRGRRGIFSSPERPYYLPFSCLLSALLHTYATNTGRRRRAPIGNR